MKTERGRARQPCRTRVGGQVRGITGAKRARPAPYACYCNSGSGSDRASGVVRGAGRDAGRCIRRLPKTRQGRTALRWRCGVTMRVGAVRRGERDSDG